MSGRRQPERVLHKAVAAYLNAVLPTSVWWTTFPAGGGGLVRGANLKAMGMKAGVPDILIVYQGRAHWIELKAPRGVSSEQQKKTCEHLAWVGCAVGIARSFDDVRGLLAFWKVPTLESKRRAA